MLPCQLANDGTLEINAGKIDVVSLTGFSRYKKNASLKTLQEDTRVFFRKKIDCTCLRLQGHIETTINIENFPFVRSFSVAVNCITNTINAAFHIKQYTWAKSYILMVFSCCGFSLYQKTQLLQPKFSKFTKIPPSHKKYGHFRNKNKKTY